MKDSDVIDVECWVVSNAPPAAPEHPAARFARGLPGPVRYLLRQRMFWWWVLAISLVGLTEGLW